MCACARCCVNTTCVLRPVTKKIFLIRLSLNPLPHTMPAPCPIGLSDRFGNRRGKGGKRGEKGRKRAIFGHLHANGSHLGVERIVPGEVMRVCAVQHRQMCGQARTIPDCPSGTLPGLDKRAKVCGCIVWDGCQPPRWGIDMLAVWALEVPDAQNGGGVK